MPIETLKGVLATATELLAEFWTGVLGALISLKFVPDQATFSDRVFALVGGVALTIMFGPLVVELTGMSSKGVVMGGGALIGLFGFMVVGEVVSALKGKGQALAGLVLERLRKWLNG